MKNSDYKQMLRELPEAKLMLRSTIGQKISYHGYSEYSLCPAPTTVVAFLTDGHISHIDRGDYAPEGAMKVIDYNESDRYEVYARLKLEGADKKDIAKELSFSDLDLKKADYQF